jgi:hypothetical protein
MATWGKGSNIQSVNVTHVDTGDVSDGSSQGFAALINDEKWASSHLMSSVPEFTSTASQLFIGHNSSDIFPKS